VRNLRNSLNIWTYTVQLFKFSTFKDHVTSWPATSLILRLPTTTDVFGYLNRRASHIIDIHSLWRLSLTGVIWKTYASSTYAFRERLANIQRLAYLHNFISVQSTGRTRSSSLVTLARPPVSSSLRLQITNRSFTYASPYLWNQLIPSSLSLRQPHSVHSPTGSPHPTHITSSHTLRRIP